MFSRPPTLAHQKKFRLVLEWVKPFQASNLLKVDSGLSMAVAAKGKKPISPPGRSVRLCGIGLSLEDTFLLDIQLMS
jgi:hypothetical protein